MTNNRTIEIVIVIVGLEANFATDEPPNKIETFRKLILVDENQTLPEIAHKLRVTITQIEEDN